MTEMNLKLNTNTYGGVILSSDYSMYSGKRNMASRIAADLKFDEQCRKNCINRDSERKKENA